MVSGVNRNSVKVDDPQKRALEAEEPKTNDVKVDESQVSANTDTEVKQLEVAEAASKEKVDLQTREEAQSKHLLEGQQTAHVLQARFDTAIPDNNGNSELALKPDEVSSTTETALDPNATVEQRKAAAAQFIEPRTLGNSMPWASRDTEISAPDTRQALALYNAEAIREDADPQIKKDLERTLLKGLSDNTDPKFQTELAQTIADNPQFSVKTRAEAFLKETELRGLRAPYGSLPTPERAIQLGQESAALLEQFRDQDLAGRNGAGFMQVRNEALEQMYKASRAPGVTPAQKTQLEELSTILSRNLPTDPAERAILEKLSSGEIDVNTLSRNDAERANALMKRYPPIPSMSTAIQPRLDDPVAAMADGKARTEVQENVQDRLQAMDKLYADNGWSRDSDIHPGSQDSPNPAADQALLADIADRARTRGVENGRDGAALTTEDFSAISYRDTLKGLQATQNIRDAHPDIFGDPPPTDPGKLQTRERVLEMERHLRRNADIQAVTTKVDGLNQTFDRMLENRGVVGQFADGFKNNLGRPGGWVVDSNLGSDAVTDSLGDVAKARNALDEMRSFQGTDEEFAAEMEKRKTALTDALGKTQEHVADWAKSQSQWVDTVSDIGAVTAGIAGAAAAPFTLGGSLVLGGAVGAATKVSLKGLDAATGSGIYDGNLLGDLGKGFFAGASGVGAAQVSKVIGGHLATKLGGGALSRTGAFLAGESIAGAMDGAVVGTVNTLIDGGSLSDALQNGLRGGAIGGLLGPLVGGTVRGGAHLVQAVRNGSRIPSQVPLNASRDISLAHLERAGIRPDDLGGNLNVKGLEPGQTPYVRRANDGSVEMFLPVQKDGTVLAKDLGRGTEYLRLMAEARSNPQLAANVASAQRSAAEIRRLQTELGLASTPQQRTRIEAELRAARRRLQSNPAEIRAQAAGLQMAHSGGRAGIDEIGFQNARDSIQRELELIRGTGNPRRVQQLEAELKRLENPAALRQTLMQTNDIGRVQQELARLGVHADRDMIEAVKRYNFDSAGIGFYQDNYAAWKRLATGQGTPADAQYLVHEMAEVHALRQTQSRTGFDFMGRGYENMSDAQARQWQSRFNDEYLKAHRTALEAEYDFLSKHINSATNGRVNLSRNQLAAIDPTRAEARQWMLADGVPIENHHNFGQWQARGNETVQLSGSVARRLGLPPGQPVTIADLIRRIKHSPLN